ncbi:MAG: AAA family ATPase [Deltaproteobacteria bacterium]|jgi:hypothetical protein|nr:AAA family ATPase [Deltaproteobacteria bacterium]
MKLLPKGIASFLALRYKDFLYADKTKLLYELVNLQQPFFLSRPRRFGKSLTVSVLKSILEGRRELFKSLWIDSSDYDWRPYPVIHLSLSSIKTDSLDSVDKTLLADLQLIALREKLSFYVAPPDNESSQDNLAIPSVFFKYLIEGLYYKYNRSPVAILIDEYDAPILSEITQPELADQIRKALKKFYAVLKDSEEYRGFTFITGVTKFTKTSIFSDLNNLEDLTILFLKNSITWTLTILSPAL